MHKIIRTQSLNIDINTAWEFFSNPKNLYLLTPSFMDFNIISGGEGEIFPGKRITVKIKPLVNITLNWTTEIHRVTKPVGFVDVLIKGPFRFWHYQHILKEINEKVEITDIVHYVVPFTWLGKFVNKYLIEKQLNKIFDYRFHVLEKLFNQNNQQKKTALKGQ